MMYHLQEKDRAERILEELLTVLKTSFKFKFKKNKLATQKALNLNWEKKRSLAIHCLYLSVFTRVKPLILEVRRLLKY
jgi:hypothetical protein